MNPATASVPCISPKLCPYHGPLSFLTVYEDKVEMKGLSVFIFKLRKCILAELNIGGGSKEKNKSKEMEGENKSVSWIREVDG